MSNRESAIGAREGQTFEGSSLAVRYVNLVKLPHTVFALPFALVGVIFASYEKPVSWHDVLWVVVAFTSARFAAMAFNRIVDRGYDAMNPRTVAREIPTGVISVWNAGSAVAVASFVFVLATWNLNPLCFRLSPLALALVLGYSYTKRFTRWSHLVLGLGLAIAPVGGYLAVAGGWSTPWWILGLLAFGVMCWVAGFDVFYSMQDVSFDREHGLHSLPVAAGEQRALAFARVLHISTVASLALVGLSLGLGLLYWAGVAVVLGLLVYEHSLVRADDLKRLDAAFFSMNGIISIAFFFFVLAERLSRR
ncbi:MAG: UbiA-like polyprenyltransferase [Gemmatimonadaceae bacterium]